MKLKFGLLFKFWCGEKIEFKLGFKFNKTWTWMQAWAQILEWWKNRPKKKKKRSWTGVWLQIWSPPQAWLLGLVQLNFFWCREKLNHNKKKVKLYFNSNFEAKLKLKSFFFFLYLIFFFTLKEVQQEFKESNSNSVPLFFCSRKKLHYKKNGQDLIWLQKWSQARIFFPFEKKKSWTLAMFQKWG